MNALLEGDVGRVGVARDRRRSPTCAPRASARASVEIALAPGRSLETEHAFVDATRGLDAGAVDAALETLAAAGCAAIAVSGAFAVDDAGARGAGGAARAGTRAAGLRRATS